MNEIEKLWEELFKEKPKLVEEKPAEVEKPVEKPAEVEVVAPTPPAPTPTTPTPEVTPSAQILIPVPSPTSEEKVEFDVSEEVGPAKTVIVLYGLKGEGKTYCAFTLPGKIACLSFDHKSTPVKQILGEAERIKVWDAMRYEDYKDSETWLRTSVTTYEYINHLLDTVIKDWQPDWIVIDGSEIFQQVCEMVMRYRNNLLPFQGIANMNLWKERRLYIRQIHNKCLRIAKKGVVYTTYTDKDRIVSEGELVVQKDVPRWIDAIMYETDVVIKCESTFDRTAGKKFYAIVESSKNPNIKTGLRLDVTDKGLRELKI
jgi:hypothetical protein